MEPEEKRIGSKGVVLFFMFFSNLYIVLALSSSSPLHQEISSSAPKNHSPKDFMQDQNSRGRSTYEQSSKGIDVSETGKKAIEHSNKFAHGFGHGSANAGGTRPTNPGESNGNRQPTTPGGATFVPVYAAGAANNRHPYHRGAANSNQIGVPTLIAATMASLLHLYMVFRYG